MTSTTTRALYRTALLATADELERLDEHRAASAARRAAATGGTDRMRWVLAHPYATAR